MSYLALYRKYRPSNFDEVFGQKYIVNIIKNAVISGKVSHAYLFSGPRGTGKTTIAKLLAKMVNCSNFNFEIAEPCNTCDSCSLIMNKANPDIIEIDAASNNGVDEIRVIRDKVSLMPSVSKYKVYIIDEVHMLSTSAFNALLKTLEEPPAHVIFVLATTELYKVPETIISRCQCYEFERLKVDDIVDCLKRIVDKEKLNVDLEVLKLIADYSNGGMRDSISLLDKLCSCADYVDKSLFYDVVGLVDDSQIHSLISEMINGSYKASLNIINNLEKNGKNINYLITQIINYLKNCIVGDNNFISETIALLMIEEFNELQYKLKGANDLNLSFEVGILKIVNKLKDNNLDDKIISREIISDKDDNINNLDVNEKSAKIDKIVEKDEQKFVQIESYDFSTVINNAFALADKNLKNDILTKWNGFYEYVHNKEFSSVVSYLLDGNLQVAGEKDIIISLGYDSVLSGAVSNLAKIELLFNLVMGKAYNIAFVIDSEWDLLKEKYIADVRNGVKYQYTLENNKKDVIINDDDVTFDGVENDNVIDEKSAAGIFGSDIVEIK